MKIFVKKFMSNRKCLLQKTHFTTKWILMTQLVDVTGVCQQILSAIRRRVQITGALYNRDKCTSKVDAAIATSK